MRDAYDWATLVIAGVGVAIVAVSAVIQAWAVIVSQHQVTAMRDQIALSVRQQRPWIATGAPKDERIWKLDDAASISFSIPVKNVGSTTAKAIYIQAEIVGRDEKTHNDTVTARVKALCQQAEMDPSYGWSSSLFPGESDTMRGADVVHTSLKHALNKIGSGEYLSMTLVGCITYRYDASEVFQHTPFAYDIVDARDPVPDDDRNYMTRDTVPFVDGASVKFVRSSYGNGSPD